MADSGGTDIVAGMAAVPAAGSGISDAQLYITGTGGIRGRPSASDGWNLAGIWADIRRSDAGTHSLFGTLRSPSDAEENTETGFYTACLLYTSCIAVVPVGIVCFHTYRKNRIQRRKEELYDSFRDLIAWMHTALRSGYSMENAVLEAAGQLEQSLGKENILVQELRRMRHKMMISVPVEQLFQDLAVRSRIDDIATFASVLVIAKRTGGNVCEIFQNTWDIFCTRIDTMREIRAGVSSRRFEQNIMSVVPFGILGYVQLSFPEFLSVMYGNVIGVFFMSGCLAVYLAAWVLGKKILDIEF